VWSAVRAGSAKSVIHQRRVSFCQLVTAAAAAAAGDRHRLYHAVNACLTDLSDARLNALSRYDAVTSVSFFAFKIL